MEYTSYVFHSYETFLLFYGWEIVISREKFYQRHDYIENVVLFVSDRIRIGWPT